MFLITRRGGDTIDDSLQPGARIQLYRTRAAAERDLKMVLSRDKQELFEVKPVEISEALPWVK